MKVLVLMGGPDRERPVSLQSGAQVAAALREAGHEVLKHDAGPGDLSALAAFSEWGGDVVFPVLHGKWGEGGGVQRILEQRRMAFVGCRAEAAALCMDKDRTKQVLRKRGLPTPTSEVVGAAERIHLSPPLVLKAVDEGSSFGLAICPDAAAVERAQRELGASFDRLLAEQFVRGKEITVGVIAGAVDEARLTALPPIHIVPATSYYDYEAKYNRDDTQYRFDIDLPADVLQQVSELGLAACQALGVRHMSRVDFIVDEANQPWILEVNTIPGFTTHSLLPMAARRAGLELPALVDRLVRLALVERQPGA